MPSDITTATPDAHQVLRGMYAAEAEYLAAGGPGAASFEPLAPFYDEDVVLHQAAGLPYGGRWVGHAGMEQFFLRMARTWEAFDMLQQRFLSQPGGDEAVVLTDVRARARATGSRLEFPILQTVTTVAGRITEVRPFYWDTNAIAAACAVGGSELAKPTAD